MSINWNEARQGWHWQFKATVSGRRYRLSKLLPRGWSEAQARKFDQAETARTFARLASGEDLTVARIEQVVKLYLDHRVPELRDGKNSALNLVHLLPWYQGKGVDQLGAISREYRKSQNKLPKDERLEPATLRQRLATLRAAANYALKSHGVGKKEYIEQMSMPSVNNERHYYLTREDIVRTARACQHRPTRAWILITYATGMRPGEIYRAERKADFLLMPETKNGQRVLTPIHPKVRRYLRHWPLTLNYTSYSKYWRDALKRVGLEHIHAHDLRHSTASALVSGGATLPQVGKVLAHKSLQSTNRYAHLFTEKKIELLDSLWQKRPNKNEGK